MERLQRALARFGGRLGLGFVAAGLVAILLGWNGVASNVAVAAQLPYLVSGLGLGMALVGTGAALVVVQAGREDRARLEAKLDEVIAAVARATPVAPADAAGLVVAGTSSYHAPDCRLVAGRAQVDYLTVDEAEERGLLACRVCEPDRAPTG